MCVSCVIVRIVANTLVLLIGVVAAMPTLLDDDDDRDDDNDDDTPGKEMYSLPTIPPPPAMAEASNADSPPTLSYRDPTLLDISVVT